MSEMENLYWAENGEEGPPQSSLFLPSGARGNKNSQSGPRSWRGCTHWRQRFELRDGLYVFASAWLDSPEEQFLIDEGFDGQPDIGFYLDPTWASRSLVISPGMALPSGLRATPGLVLFPWSDWGVPENPHLLRIILVWLLEEATSGKIIEIGCLGGHGRTGTALACLLVLQGLTTKQAIRRVWQDYCDLAIETKSQLSLIKSFA